MNITNAIKLRKDGAYIFINQTLFRILCTMMVMSSVFLFLGCATTVQQVPLATGEVKADQSRVCIYCFGWPPRLMAKISDGDTPIGNLANKGVVCWDRAPGKTVIRSKLPHAEGVWGAAQAELPLDLMAGQTYYVQAVWDANNWLIQLSKASLVPRSKQEATADITRECKAP